MFILITSDTAKKYSYDGLANRVLSQPSNMYCVADHYTVPTYIWKHVSNDKRGCMLLQVA
jgi:hypothetical protein